MRKFFKELLFFTILFAQFGLLIGQESVNTTGGEVFGNSGTISYSVGQLVYQSISGNSISVSQGVQQTYLIFPIGFIESNLQLSISLYPNPTSNDLTLDLNENNIEKYSFEMFDLQGSLLMNNQITAQKTVIDTSNLPTSCYLIHLYNEKHQNIRSFKIVKN
jgi:hypothetical protein